MPSINIYSAEYGSHAAPSMNPEQAAKARRWANPIAVSVFVYLLAALGSSEGWLGWIPEATLVGIAVLWMVEVAVMLRLTPDNREWFARNKIDIVAVTVAIATLPIFPGVLSGFAVFAAFIRFFDIIAAIARYVRITSLTYVLIFFPLAVYCGGLAFHQLETIPDGGGSPGLLESFYWGMVSLTSVGFGDLSAHTAAAQALCLLFLPLSPLLLALIVSAIIPHMEREIRDLVIIRYRHRGDRGELSSDERDELTTLERLKLESEDEGGGITLANDERLDELLRLTRTIHSGVGSASPDEPAPRAD